MILLFCYIKKASLFLYTDINIYVSYSEAKVLAKGWSSLALELAWAVLTVLEERSRYTSFALAALIFSESLVDILDGTVSAAVVDSCGFVIAVFA